MPALTPSFLFDLESRMRQIRENEYLELAKDLWWDKTAKVMTSGGRREIVGRVRPTPPDRKRRAVARRCEAVALSSAPLAGCHRLVR